MTQEYDDSGRLIRHIDAFGYTIEYERIPIESDAGCRLSVVAEHFTAQPPHKIAFGADLRPNPMPLR